VSSIACLFLFGAGAVVYVLAIVTLGHFIEQGLEGRLDERQKRELRRLDEAAAPPGRDTDLDP